VSDSHVSIENTVVTVLASISIEDSVDGRRKGGDRHAYHAGGPYISIQNKIYYRLTALENM